jgi:hypothetical protein
MLALNLGLEIVAIHPVSEGNLGCPKENDRRFVIAGLTRLSISFEKGLLAKKMDTRVKPAYDVCRPIANPAELPHASA